MEMDAHIKGDVLSTEEQKARGGEIFVIVTADVPGVVTDQ